MLRSSLFTLTVLAAAARAQTTYVEVEPNDTKPTANVVPACLAPGDQLVGDSTGTAAVPPAATTGDVFHVQFCADGLGLYRSQLVLTTSTGTLHKGQIQGVQQVAGVPIPGSDISLQSSILTSTPPAMVQWYGFGKGERLFYRVSGSATTTGTYTATFAKALLSPTVVPGAFVPGTITVSSVGQTTTDTEIYVYDAAFAPVPTMHNDDAGPGGSVRQSTIARPLVAGVYYVAISRFNLANDQPDANVDEYFQDESLVDGANAVLTTSSALGVTDVDFTLSDGVTTVPVTATTSGAFDVAWFRFTVGSPPTFGAFCFGDGTFVDHATACPCGNVGAPGNGCANSAVANGANLTATGLAATNDVVLRGSGMPNTVSCIYLQGTAPDDAVFGDGVRCTGGTLLRLRTKANVAGASSFPDSVETITLSQRGGVTVGSGVRRYYQTYYRNSSGLWCPPETFNVTNGWVIDW
ncbi:MAG: hypothetical protein IPJ77_09245 [Planctomycetes bacterium]|nr:hypothetical protein [Planctomycetota bacterium]